MGLFAKREANRAERQVWTVLQATNEILALGRNQVETFIGPTTEEYDSLEQAVFAAAADFNRAYAASEWRTIGNQHDAWTVAMHYLDAYMQDNNYGPLIQAAKETKNGVVA